MSDKWLRSTWAWPAVLALTTLLVPALLSAGVAPGLGPVTATVESKPETLNILGNGTFAVVIELPTPQGAMMIDPGTVAITRVGGELVEPVRPVAKPPILGDSDEDGIADMKFQFRRCDLRDVLPAPVGSGRSFLQMTISGQLTDGTLFEGTETVKLIYRQ